MSLKLVVNLKAFTIPIIIAVLGFILLTCEGLPILVKIMGGILAFSAVLAAFSMVLLLIGMQEAVRELEQKEMRYEVEENEPDREKLKKS